ncbi:hypothetical protein IPA_04510 [Ignicoccus pacificus DSM 13166]|uniref:CBS domain-containing protein n=1 Tax=Ignicoccus pacificus DSM 13166 TaxID=940294 RepID=A0A977KB43_9CREN|nr:hypothetical protein IPA_04510 [Ignicoccus pacificus DSM 13166]
MRPRVPEGPRFLRSDGTPDKMTRVHKEQKWINETKEPEVLHSPNAPLRSVVIELLQSNLLNVIVAEGDKYLGVGTLPKVTALIALWRDRNTPIYKIFLEPLKRLEERVPPITDEMNDKDVSKLLDENALIDEYPVVSNEKVVAILPVREIIGKYSPSAPSVQLSSIAQEVPKVGSVGEALLVMEEKGVPVVLVEDKVLDARSVLKKIWDERRKSIGEVSFDDVATENFNLFKASLTLKEILEEIDPHKVDYILVDDDGKVKYVPLGRVASKLLH